MSAEEFIPQTKSGSAWRRHYMVNIMNQYSQAPVMQCVREKAMLVEGVFFSSPDGSVQERLTTENLYEEFDLVHLDTLQPLGKKMTNLEFSIAIQSKAHSMSQKQDAQAAAELAAAQGQGGV